jgi:hypothetical protein
MFPVSVLGLVMSEPESEPGQIWIKILLSLELSLSICNIQRSRVGTWIRNESHLDLTSLVSVLGSVLNRNLIRTGSHLDLMSYVSLTVLGSVFPFAIFNAAESEPVSKRLSLKSKPESKPNHLGMDLTSPSHSWAQFFYCNLHVSAIRPIPLFTWSHITLPLLPSPYLALFPNNAIVSGCDILFTSYI